MVEGDHLSYVPYFKGINLIHEYSTFPPDAITVRVRASIYELWGHIQPVSASQHREQCDIKEKGRASEVSLVSAILPEGR